MVCHLILFVALVPVYVPVHLIPGSPFSFPRNIVLAALLLWERFALAWVRLQLRLGGLSKSAPPSGKWYRTPVPQDW